jgi:hypothetical protein
VCTAGACQDNCGAGETLCTDNDGGAPYCARTDSDNQNCGGCAMQCPQGQSCQVGVCAVACQSGLTACGPQCVDTKTSRSNCGGCGNACPQNSVSCVGGVCQ